MGHPVGQGEQEHPTTHVASEGKGVEEAMGGGGGVTGGWGLSTSKQNPRPHSQ
jgi:hypothetical protein